MPAYMIVKVKITDPERFNEYRKAVTKLVPNYGGRYLARGTVDTVLEGEFDMGERVVLEEYPSVDHIKRMWASPEYQEIMKLRENAAEATVIVMDGEE
ncbi:MAG: DUF1330 domain-containing protein [Gammaproteobacteria bacterium]|jgi:uncharacterized protein (DUF1330 family)